MEACLLVGFFLVRPVVVVDRAVGDGGDEYREHEEVCDLESLLFFDVVEQVHTVFDASCCI